MIGGVKHVVVNEGQEEKFLELFRTLKSEMVRHEPGNVYYDLYRSRNPALTTSTTRPTAGLPAESVFPLALYSGRGLG